MVVALILWLCVFLNLFSFGYHLSLRRKLKIARGRDAELLNAAADIVRASGRGDYIDGEFANMIAGGLEAQALQALIIGGYMDREVRAWAKHLRDEGGENHE